MTVPCEVCGKPTTSKNGVCGHGSPECVNEYARRRRRAESLAKAPAPPCEVCGWPTRSKYGVCYERTPECAREHRRRDWLAHQNERSVRVERQCTACGRTFRTGTNLLCPQCQATERECVTCGKTFRGAMRSCPQCKTTERECTRCGESFQAHSNGICSKCRTRDHTCTDCGRAFRGHQDTCRACTSRNRECVTCGRSYRGTERLCWQCRVEEHPCTSCGEMFRATGRYCPACQSRNRECHSCGQPFRGRFRLCKQCRKIERECASCHLMFLGDRLLCDICRRLAEDPVERSAAARRRGHRRRAIQVGAEIAGPVSTETYARILASGPCVYDGRPAEHVDHVRPLSRGGAEHESNLVPACAKCNMSKNARLLTEWDPARVAHAVAHSTAVADEYQRLAREALPTG